MLLSPGKAGLDSLFKEIRVFKAAGKMLAISIYNAPDDALEITSATGANKMRDFQAPPTPRVLKDFGSRHVEFEVLICGGDCVKFLEAIFPGN